MNYYECCNIWEILAYRDLESEVFDFGEGPMSIEGLHGSEDAYYEMAIQDYYDNQDNYNHSQCMDFEDYYPRLNEGRRSKRGKHSEQSKPNGGVNYCKVVQRRLRLTRVHKRQRNKVVRKENNILSGGSYKKLYNCL